VDHKTRDFNAQSSTRFWGRRRTRIASATGSLVLAVVATIFMLGGGPSHVTWLQGGNTSWLPFSGSVSWLPFGHASAGKATTHAKPKPTATPVPVVVATTPTPVPVVVHTPVPTARPTAVPTAEPTARPTATPTPKPTPTPTPSGPAPGTILFSDNFENDPLGPAVANWSLTPAGAWSIAADGSHVLAESGNPFPTAITGSQTWTNYKVSADVKTNPVNGHARLIARHYGDGYFYACGIDHPGALFLGKEYGGTWYTFKYSPFSYTDTAWYHIDFTVNGSSLTCTVTDPVSKASVTVTDTETYFPSGGAGVTGDTQAEFDNFVVTAL
jgi:hypothetical protein